MRTFSRTTQFKKDVKLAGKRGKELEKLKAVLDLLIAGGELPAANCRRHTRITRCAATLPAAAIAILNRTGC